MDLFLTARSGFTRGATWVVREEPLTLGRARTCDIVVDDRSVSRRHCIVHRDGSGVRLQDAGSRNPTLANGIPIADATLRVGDEFTVGPATFLIAATSAPLAVDPVRAKAEETVSTAVSETGLFADEETPREPGRWSANPDDYQMLFRFSRSLSLRSDVRELIATACDFFRERFGSDDLIIARMLGSRWIGIYPENATIPETLADWCEAAKRRQRAYVAAVDGLDPHMIAPVRCGPTDLGVCVLRIDEQNPVDAQAAISIFSAACELLGPFLQNLEQLERLASANARLVDVHEAHMGIVGDSRSTQRLRQTIRQIAKTDLTVLIQGETGTGKELVARSLHDASNRADRPYVAVNCASIADELFESEFFGHARGSFTGAVTAKKGLVELANKGTLFLDEVGELSSANQAKLLRVVELGAYRRVGEEHERETDVRFIAASNSSLATPGFRSDLYHRLSGFVINLTPLRQRPSDIPALAQFFLDGVHARTPDRYRVFHPEAIEAMTEYDWPGNARELRNVVERAAQLCEGETIYASHLFEGRSLPRNGHTNGLRPLTEVEKEHIASVLSGCNWNVSKAARTLGISRSTLYQKISEYGLRDA